MLIRCGSAAGFIAMAPMASILASLSIGSSFLSLASRYNTKVLISSAGSSGSRIEQELQVTIQYIHGKGVSIHKKTISSTSWKPKQFPTPTGNPQIYQTRLAYLEMENRKHSNEDGEQNIIRIIWKRMISENKLPFL